MFVPYTLTFINGSATAGAACLYQTAPPNLQSLAWLVRNVDAAGGTQPTATFTWTLDYGFMFMEPSGSGTGFAQVMSANPAGQQNQVTFTTTNEGYAFLDPIAGTSGSLIIDETSTVLVGFAMSGTPLFGAAPPAVTLTFPTTPTPPYMLAFGDFSPSQVMPATPPATSPTPIAVVYPSGVFAMTATLSADNVLTVAPS